MSAAARTAVALLGAGLLVLAGCQTVKPWEREVLARPDMAWEPDAMGAALDAHIFFSKEASLAGGAAAGGGCGCN